MALLTFAPTVLVRWNRTVLMVLKGMSSVAGVATILMYPTMNKCISSRTWSRLRESASCGICRVSFHRHWEGVWSVT